MFFALTRCWLASKHAREPLLAVSKSSQLPAGPGKVPAPWMAIYKFKKKKIAVTRTAQGCCWQVAWNMEVTMRLPKEWLPTLEVGAIWWRHWRLKGEGCCASLSSTQCTIKVGWRSLLIVCGNVEIAMFCKVMGVKMRSSSRHGNMEGRHFVQKLRMKNEVDILMACMEQIMVDSLRMGWIISVGSTELLLLFRTCYFWPKKRPCAHAKRSSLG